MAESVVVLLRIDGGTYLFGCVSLAAFDTEGLSDDSACWRLSAGGMYEPPPVAGVSVLISDIFDDLDVVSTVAGFEIGWTFSSTSSSLKSSSFLFLALKQI